MKQRFSSLDVRVIAHELSAALTSLRIANIYDLSSRIFLFKCAKPGSREQLLVDSGFRCHLTSFTRTAASAPSVFVTRLRKHLKTRRITSVAQIGTDRVIEIVFSDGMYRIFLEFFAAGNIVLVDREYSILALLRQVSEGDEDVDVKVGGKYSVEVKQNFLGVPPVTKERVRDVLEQQVERTKTAGEIGGKKAKRHKGAEDLKKALSTGFSEYPSHLLDHAFKTKGFDSATKPEEVLGNEEILTNLMVSVEYADEIFRSLGLSDDAKGYIIAKLKDKAIVDDENPIAGNEPARDNLLYDDFHPFRPSQFEGRSGIHILEILGFNKTVDEFYSSIESQKLESRLTEREEAAKRKLEAAKAEHEKRVGALQHVQELHIRKAQTIEANTHRIEEAVAAVNGLIGQGMDWMDIAKLIENEKARGNAVAEMVKLPLKLYENTVTLLLDEPGAEEEDDDEEFDEAYNSEDESLSEDEQTKPAVPRREKLSIDIDLALSPWANARQYYDQKKTAAVKEQKTVQASTRALKSTEKKIEADLKKVLKQETQTLRPARRKFFFENFLYFVSSDGYLVLGGKDANQNEILYRRHLKKGDVYVHADLQGAASVVVKNKANSPDAPIPPGTLSQAGALAVCTSIAWESKAVMAAWWVKAEQVSKIVPTTGQYLGKEGNFVIKGDKNFLPPSQLLLGFGVMWLIGEESRGNHGKLRVQETASENVATSGVASLADYADNLSIQGSEAGDAESGGVEILSDVEDAADETEKTMDDGTNPNADLSDEENDKASSVASDADPDPEGERANPLQMKGGNAGAEESESDGQDLHEQDGDLPHDRDHEEADSIAGSSAARDTGGLPIASASASQSASTQSSKPKATQIPRGKRTKAARAAKKYAEQDEADRALAMSLLGSNKQQQAKTDAEAEQKEREEKTARDKERRRAQHDRAKREEEKRLAGDDGHENAALADQDQELLAQEAADMSNLDLLVPSLMPSDMLIAAVPVVAPWSALSRYKYKAKLQPGNVKKGKAVREIVGSWTSLDKKGGKIIDNESKDRERVWSVEVAKIKDWRVEEIVGVLPVKGVRVVQSGGTAGASTGGGAKGKGGSGSGGKGGKGNKKGR